MAKISQVPARRAPSLKRAATVGAAGFLTLSLLVGGVSAYKHQQAQRIVQTNRLEQTFKGTSYPRSYALVAHKYGLGKEHKEELKLAGQIAEATIAKKGAVSAGDVDSVLRTLGAHIDHISTYNVDKTDVFNTLPSYLEVRIGQLTNSKIGADALKRARLKREISILQKFSEYVERDPALAKDVVRMLSEKIN